jgi:hypothetical protein
MDYGMVCMNIRQGIYIYIYIYFFFLIMVAYEETEQQKTEAFVQSRHIQ